MTAVVCKQLANGVMVPAVHLGTWKVQEPGVEEVLEAALKSGYRAIDGATVYNNDDQIGPQLYRGERVWLSPNKDMRERLTHIPEGFEIVDDFEASFSVPHGPCSHKVFVTTKVWCTDFDKDMRKWVQDYLRLYKRERVDMLLLHWPGASNDGSLNFEQHCERNMQLRFNVWKQLETLYHEGLIRAIGVSNFMNKHLEPLIADVLLRRKAGDKTAVIPMCNQVEGNPWVQTMNLVKDLCKEYNIAISCYRPLGGDDVQYTNHMEEFVEKETGRPQALILLRWLLQQGYIVLPKSRNPDRIKMNADIFSFELQPKHMSSLQQLFQYDVDPLDNPMNVE